MPDKDNLWLKWATEIDAIAQAGLTYCKDGFGLERYEALKKLAAEIAAEYSNHDFEKIYALFKEEKGYATPKVDARGAVFKEDQILLVRERDDHCWTLPGGWIDINESPSEAVVREVFEESGYQTKAIKLLALYDKHKHPHPPQWPHAYKCFFLCELLGGEPTTCLEISEVGFFSEDNLPELSQHRVVESQIHRLFEHYRQPDLMTDFD